MNHKRRSCAQRWVVLLGIITCAPFAQAQPQRGGLPAPAESIIPSRPVEVTLHRFNRLPAIDVTINGRGPFRLIVDTGAAGLILKSDLAKELDLPAPPGMPAGGAQIKLRSPGSDNISASLVFVDELSVGQAKFHGVWTVGVDLPFGDDMDGVIGMNIFHECLLTYDYPAGILRLARGDLPPANGRDILSFSTTSSQPGSHPVIELSMGGQTAQFLIDTGMRGWFAIPAKRAKKMSMAAGPVAGPKAQFVGGSRQLEFARLNTSFRIGQYTVERPIVHLSKEGGMASLGTGSVLGTMFLEHFIVTFDARNKRVRFARESLASITPPPMRNLGISMKRTGQQMEVWDVHPDSHAASLGFTEGSVVHSVNGQPAVELFGTIKWYDLMQSSNQVQVRYSQRTDDEVRTADVRVMELLP